MRSKNKNKRRGQYHPVPNIQPGAAPASLETQPGARLPIVTLIAYGPEAMVEKVVVSPFDPGAWQKEWPVVWIQVDGLEHAEKMKEIGEVTGVHPLSLEDAVTPGHRPKLEEYDENLFLLLAALAHNPTTADGSAGNGSDATGPAIDIRQFSVFLSHRLVVTFQEGPLESVDRLKERLRQPTARIRRRGADYLVYALLDSVVDHFFPAIERMGDEITLLEEDILADPTKDWMPRIHRARRELLALARSLWPLREVVSHFLKDDSEILSEDIHPFVRDCHDHVIQAIELVAAFQEAMAALSDLQMSAASHRMNEIMKVLTIIATLFIPLTFIAGIYGMNFDSNRSPFNMPELGWYWGYPFALGLMTLVALILLYYFRRKKWL